MCFLQYISMYLCLYYINIYILYIYLYKYIAILQSKTIKLWYLTCNLLHGWYHSTYAEDIVNYIEADKIG